MNRKPHRRLGAGTDGEDLIKDHPFYRTVDWTKLTNREVEPPFKPVTVSTAVLVIQGTVIFVPIWPDYLTFF